MELDAHGRRLGSRSVAPWSISACCSPSRTMATCRARASMTGPARADDLCAGARRLLHLLDLLRLGRASRPRSGLDFLTIYIGPILVIGLGHALVCARRAARQGPEHHLDRRLRGGALRQERAGRGARVAHRGDRLDALHRAAAQGGLGFAQRIPVERRRAADPRSCRRSSAISRFLVALVLAGFAIAFGTRHIDATEHQDGLMLAIAIESVVKLAAFLAVGIYRDLRACSTASAISSARLARAPTSRRRIARSRVGTAAASAR